MPYTLGTLTSAPALDHPDLLGPTVRRAVEGLPFAAEIEVVAIDAGHAETSATNEVYGVPLDAGANCVVVMGKREGQERVAACLVRSDLRADVNNVVKRTLDVRKCSFLSQDRAVQEARMEYGGINPIGLPASWRLLVDPHVLEVPIVLIGSGIRGSKILMPGRRSADLPGAEVVEGLAG